MSVPEPDPLSPYIQTTQMTQEMPLSLQELRDFTARFQISGQGLSGEAMCGSVGCVGWVHNIRACAPDKAKGKSTTPVLKRTP